MSRIIYDGHVQVLILHNTGEVPTVPVPSTLTPVDDGWDAEFNIMIGGLAVNKVDNKIWTRNNNGIFQINGGGSGTVQSVTGAPVDNTDPSNPVVNAPTQVSFDTLNSYVVDTLAGQVSANAAAISAHINDSSDAHDASAISNVPAGNISSSDVQGALNELDSEKASTTYVDSSIASAVAGLMDYRGIFDASVNAYPSSGGSGTAGAILKSDFWIVSVAGTLPTGLIVEAGDLIIAKIDTPGNTQANWNIVQYNIGYTPENSANKDNGPIASSTTKYPSNAGLIDYAQPLDSDLTAIAGLSPSNDDVVQRKAGAWTNRTMAQLGADLATTLVKQTITDGVTDSAPSQDIVFDTLAARPIFTIFCSSLSLASPADNTAYYWGAFPGVQLATSQNFNIFTFPINCVVRGAIISSRQATNGSSESSTIYLRESNTTDYQISNAVKNDSGNNSSVSIAVSGLNISVTAGTQYEMKIQTASWATNPTTVIYTVILLCYAS